MLFLSTTSQPGSNGHQYTKRIVIFEVSIRIFINKSLVIIPDFSSFISGYIILGRNIFVQNLTTWVKFAPAIIYIQFSKTEYTQKMIVFDSWIIIVIHEVLLIIFTYSPFISVDVNFKGFIPYQISQPGSNAHQQISMISYQNMFIASE